MSISKIEICHWKYEHKDEKLFQVSSFELIRPWQKEVMFLVALVCRSVSLFVSEQHYSKCYEQITMKYY